MLMTAISYDVDSGQVARGVLVAHQQYDTAVCLEEGKRLLNALPILLPEPLMSHWKASNRRIMVPAVSQQYRKSKGSYLVGAASALDLAPESFLVARVNTQLTALDQVFQDDLGQSLKMLMTGHRGGFAQMAMVLPAGKIISIHGDAGIVYAFFNGRILRHTTAIGRKIDYGFKDEADAVREEMPRKFPRNARAT